MLFCSVIQPYLYASIFLYVSSGIHVSLIFDVVKCHLAMHKSHMGQYAIVFLYQWFLRMYMAYAAEMISESNLFDRIVEVKFIR